MDDTKNFALFDSELQDIVHYCFTNHNFPQSTLLNAHIALMDAMSCAILSLTDQHCRQHLGPIVDNAELTNGVKIPGTHFKLEPVQAAYNISCMIRWLDYNDTWLAQEWGHPSDNLGAILACADYYSKNNTHYYTMAQILDALIKAYEIQGILALNNSFNKLGFDHVILVRIASTALSVLLLGGNEQQMINALSNAFIDGAALRVYRHGDNTGQRKSWAAADASSRGVRHALLALKNEPGYPTVLTAKTWGFNTVLLKNTHLIRNEAYQHYVIDNILYKISYPVEFHAQTAVECAIKLHSIFSTHYNCNTSKIAKITIFTQRAAMKIINKPGILRNPADRDHSIQYAVAVALLTGTLVTEHYHDNYALEENNKLNIQTVTDKISVFEDEQYSADYYDADKRAIPNRIEIEFENNKVYSEQVLYPLGHKLRREQGLPLLKDKYRTSMSTFYTDEKNQAIMDLYSNYDKFISLSITEWMSLMHL